MKQQEHTQCSAEHGSTHFSMKRRSTWDQVCSSWSQSIYCCNHKSSQHVAAAQMCLPEWSRAPRAYRVSKALSIAAVGGLSMKSKPTRSSNPRALSCRATVAKLTRWISGRVVGASWLKLASVKSLKALPAASRPAQQPHLSPHA